MQNITTHTNCGPNFISVRAGVAALPFTQENPNRACLLQRCLVKPSRELSDFFPRVVLCLFLEPCASELKPLCWEMLRMPRSVLQVCCNLCCLLCYFSAAKELCCKLCCYLCCFSAVQKSVLQTVLPTVSFFWLSKRCVAHCVVNCVAFPTGHSALQIVLPTVLLLRP